MVERPVLFTGPMVRAILEGEKTQTRRPVKPQPIPECASMMDCGFDVKTDKEIFGGRDKAGRALYPFPVADHSFVPEILCPYGKPGDVLWVRETWSHAKQPAGDRAVPPRLMNPRYPWDIRYRADDCGPSGGRWRPSVHMPKWACRIRLLVTGVRVERVQEISSVGARAEGADCRTDLSWDGTTDDPLFYEKGHLAGFVDGWDSIYAKGDFAWAKNPWVWVVTFEREDSTVGASGGK